MLDSVYSISVHRRFERQRVHDWNSRGLFMVERHRMQSNIAETLRKYFKFSPFSPFSPCVVCGQPSCPGRPALGGFWVFRKRGASMETVFWELDPEATWPEPVQAFPYSPFLKTSRPMTGNSIGRRLGPLLVILKQSKLYFCYLTYKKKLFPTIRNLIAELNHSISV